MRVVTKMWSDGTPFTIQREETRVIITTPRNGGEYRRTSEMIISCSDGSAVSYPLMQMGVGDSIEDARRMVGIILSADREEAIIDFEQNNG